jgi:hypothetical protein
VAFGEGVDARPFSFQNLDPKAEYLRLITTAVLKKQELSDWCSQPIRQWRLSPRHLPKVATRSGHRTHCGGSQMGGARQIPSGVISIPEDKDLSSPSGTAL